MVRSFEVILSGFGEVRKATTWDEIPIRTVDVPLADFPDEDEERLNTIYKYGQNMFQASDKYRSVSAGDIVVFKGKLWVVDNFGFVEISDYDSIGKVKSLPKDEIIKALIFAKSKDLLY